MSRPSMVDCDDHILGHRLTCATCSPMPSSKGWKAVDSRGSSDFGPFSRGHVLGRVHIIKGKSGPNRGNQP